MKYEIKITFTTDRPLTSEEQFQIVGACQVHVKEPVDAEGDNITAEVSEVNARISEVSRPAKLAINFSTCQSGRLENPPASLASPII